MDISWGLAEGKERASEIRPDLFALFQQCFNREFPYSLWERLYLNNPYGPVVSAVGYVGERLVAHCAMIPQRLTNEKGEEFPYWFYMTITIDPEFRGTGAFRKVTELGHEHANQSSRLCIVGFPNANSYGPFRAVREWQFLYESELLDWVPQKPDKVSDLQATQLKSWRLGPGWDVPDDEQYRSWRCPGPEYEALELPNCRVIVKTQSDDLNLLDVEPLAEGSHLSLARLIHNRRLHRVVLTRHHATRLGIPESELSSHQGYILRYGLGARKKEFESSSFRLNLLLTDTF